LHFIGDEQPAVLRAPWRSKYQAAVDEPAGADDRFGHEGGDLAGGASANQLFDIVGGQSALGYSANRQR
jgi:hypothetical protein